MKNKFPVTRYRLPGPKNGDKMTNFKPKCSRTYPATCDLALVLYIYATAKEGSTSLLSFLIANDHY